MNRPEENRFIGQHECLCGHEAGTRLARVENQRTETGTSVEVRMAWL